MILIVCTGNIFRSPLAEAYLKELLKKEGLSSVEVVSAGLYAQEGIKAADTAIDLAKKDGLDISNHLSKALNPEMLQKSKIILVMEKFHKNFIENIYPDAIGKVFLLGSFIKSRKEEIEIIDPYATDYDNCKKIWDKIKRALENFVETSYDLHMIYGKSLDI